ncbi:MAG: VWA domain-containing protein [Gemmatimonadales bacterium]|nr:VWA domain-containing protein [Gemmatimonadales bacterium]
MIAIDRSGSMAGNNKLKHAKDGALDFAQSASTYDIGLISFGTDATVHLAPTPNVAELSTATAAIEIDGNTNMLAALTKAGEYLRDPRDTRAVILVTDGAPNQGTKTATLRAAEQLKAALPGFEWVAVTLPGGRGRGRHSESRSPS